MNGQHLAVGTLATLHALLKPFNDDLPNEFWGLRDGTDGPTGWIRPRGWDQIRLALAVAADAYHPLRQAEGFDLGVLAVVYEARTTLDVLLPALSGLDSHPDPQTALMALHFFTEDAYQKTLEAFHGAEKEVVAHV